MAFIEVQHTDGTVKINPDHLVGFKHIDASTTWLYWPNSEVPFFLENKSVGVLTNSNTTNYSTVRSALDGL